MCVRIANASDPETMRPGLGGEQSTVRGRGPLATSGGRREGAPPARARAKNTVMRGMQTARRRGPGCCGARITPKGDPRSARPRQETCRCAIEQPGVEDPGCSGMRGKYAAEDTWTPPRPIHQPTGRMRANTQSGTASRRTLVAPASLRAWRRRCGRSVRYPHTPGRRRTSR